MGYWGYEYDFDPSRTGPVTLRNRWPCCRGAQSRVGSVRYWVGALRTLRMMGDGPARWTPMIFPRVATWAKVFSMPWGHAPEVETIVATILLGCLTKSLVASLCCSYLGSVNWRDGVKFFWTLRDRWVKGETSAECTFYHDSRAHGHERPGTFFRLEDDVYFMFNCTYIYLIWVLQPGCI
jgi:hypothetical protein